MKQNMENTEVMDMPNETKRGVSPSKVLVFLILISIVVALVFYNQVRVLSQDPNKAALAKITALAAKVNLIIDLPTGETPVLATVTDLAPLAGNAFFTNAKIGDDVLLYPIAKEAFLYDPNANIIVEVASLNIGSQ